MPLRMFYLVGTAPHASSVREERKKGGKNGLIDFFGICHSFAPTSVTTTVLSRGLKKKNPKNLTNADFFVCAADTVSTPHHCSSDFAAIFRTFAPPRERTYTINHITVTEHTRVIFGLGIGWVSFRFFPLISVSLVSTKKKRCAHGRPSDSTRRVVCCGSSAVVSASERRRQHGVVSCPRVSINRISRPESNRNNNEPDARDRADDHSHRFTSWLSHSLEWREGAFTRAEHGGAVAPVFRCCRRFGGNTDNQRGTRFSGVTEHHVIALLQRATSHRRLSFFFCGGCRPYDFFVLARSDDDNGGRN